ncbi:uncharacterized protein LOC134658597 [Cydia amplana]|uniref:uncharacterized protein LOC134658597 n=1 Tax=Cydia amplana TaxID=1869771 RepID=UPI002FE60966
MIKKGDPPLDDVVSSLRISEITNVHVKDITDNKPDVNAVTVPKSTQKTCSNCGYHHIYGQCPAYNKTCVNCKKRHHFAKMCRSSKVASNEVNLQDDSDYYVESVTSDMSVDSLAWFQKVILPGNNPVQFKLDPGADVNILPVHIYEKVISSHPVPLKKTVSTLESWNGYKTQVKGLATFNIEVNGKMYSETFCIAGKEDATPILSRDTCVRLNLVKRVSSIEATDDRKQQLIRENEDLFVGLGKFNDPYEIKLKADTIPTSKPPYRVPLKIRPKLKEELERLEGLGIISKVTEPSEWVNRLKDEKKTTILKANSRSDVSNNSTDESPKIIYKSGKLKRRPPKKTVYYKHSNKFKKTNKHNGIKNINKKIKRCVARKDANLCEILNQINPESLSELTSCFILKQVPGKQSLLEGLNLAEENIDENSENLTPSLNSVDSMISNYSQNTIYAIKIESSETDSLVRCSESYVINEPMKANIINVSRAQMDNISFRNPKSLDTLTGELDLTDNRDHEVHPNDQRDLPTSKSIERDLFSVQTELFTSSEASVETLVNDDEKLKTHTEGNESFYQSSSNSFSHSSITLHVDNFDIASNKKYAKISLSHTKTLMDTVNDMGMFPEITRRRSSTKFNDVIVAERLITSYKLYKENEDMLNGNYNQTDDFKTKSVAQNVDHGSKSNFKPRNIEKLPFDIRKINEKYDSYTCTNESQSDKPSSSSELWDRLTAALDAQVLKLEKSLTDTIIAETKMSLNILTRFMQFGSEKHKVDIESNVNEVLNQLDEDLQCNILDGPLKPNVTSADISLSGLLHNITTGVQYNLKSSFEVLKPAVKSAEDSLDVLSIEVDKPGPSASSSHRLRPSFSAIQLFFKENATVLVGAPIFLVSLVFIYFIFVLVVNGI